MTPPPQTPQPDARPGHVPGWLLIVATLGLFIAVPALVIGILALLPEPAPPQDPNETLDWSQRDTWRAYEIVPADLNTGLMSQMRTGGRDFKKVRFEITPELERTLMTASNLARDTTRFTNPQTLAALEALEQDTGPHFYLSFLIGQHHRLNNRPEQADDAFTQAFAKAPAVLTQQLDILSDGTPAPGKTYAIGLDRIQNDIRNVSLVLVFPSLTPDETGRVYMPLYRMVYRLADLNTPPGTITPEEIDRGWFAIPGGRIGKLPGMVLIVGDS
ncbi:MAG: hypothetical protein AAF750_17350 [Planctomycetota bacterium]